MPDFVTSHDTGRQVIETFSNATHALERVRFAEAVRREVGALQADSKAWSSYVAGFELAVADGLS